MRRREFLRELGGGAAACLGVAWASNTSGQEPGERPRRKGEVEVVLPRTRVPVGLIIDDSTCLVNLNRFAMPQFDTAWNGSDATYHRDWKSWPAEIPDAFVRKFAEWSAEEGVKGKYSFVPFPACVGRIDDELPGWSQREVRESIDLVRKLILPNWDIHPEMVTHTRIIDLKTGRPHADHSPKYMENWDWTTMRSVDEIAAYQAYALRILKNVDLSCEGVTTPGGYGNRARPQLAQATFDSVRDVFGAEIPHYFRDLFTDETSVAPIVQLARGLDTDQPRCVVSVIGCTGDWTGGWDNVEPEGADFFLSADWESGRLVEVIDRGEPAMMVCHWTGIYWNGLEKGFDVFKEVTRRLKERYAERIVWMKLSELARYWAAKELTGWMVESNRIRFHAPYACPDFTIAIPGVAPPRMYLHGDARTDLSRVAGKESLRRNTFFSERERTFVTIDLPKGASEIQLGT